MATQQSLAAKSRWAAVAPEERRRIAYELAVARHGECAPMGTPKARVGTKPCEHCGAPVVNLAHVRFCTAPDCKRAKNRERQRRYMHERRARLNQNDWEAFDPREVYERDGWVCGLCEEPVDASLTFPHPGSVSLDHIVPVSLGGPHTRENTRCSHFGCNARRGNRVA